MDLNYKIVKIQSFCMKQQKPPEIIEYIIIISILKLHILQKKKKGGKANVKYL